MTQIKRFVNQETV